MTRKLLSWFVLVALIFGVGLIACGGTAPVEEAEAVLSEEAAPAEEEAVVEEVVEEEVAEEVVEVAFDLIASVDGYLSTIPDGYMNVGQIDAFKEVMDSGAAVLIDVREVGEYEAGHLENAVNVPLRTIAQNLDKIPADQPVMIYCKSGFRAALALSSLRMLGYDNVRSFSAGYDGWTAAEEPVVMDAFAGDSYDVPEIEAELLAAVDGFLSTIPEGFLSVGNLEKFTDAVDNGSFVVDVRTAGEYDAGYIDVGEVLNVPLRTLAQNLDQIPSDQPVLVYCKSGHRAALSTAALHVMGHTNVRAFPAGVNGWEAAGQPFAGVQE